MRLGERVGNARAAACVRSLSGCRQPDLLSGPSHLRQSVFHSRGCKVLSSASQRVRPQCGSVLRECGVARECAPRPLDVPPHESRVKAVTVVLVPWMLDRVACECAACTAAIAGSVAAACMVHHSERPSLSLQMFCQCSRHRGMRAEAEDEDFAREKADIMSEIESLEPDPGHVLRSSPSMTSRDISSFRNMSFSTLGGSQRTIVTDYGDEASSDVGGTVTRDPTPDTIRNEYGSSASLHGHDA